MGTWYIEYFEYLLALSFFSLGQGVSFCSLCDKTIIKRYTNLRPEKNIAIRYVQVSAELAATLAVLLLQFLLVGHRRPPDIVGMLYNKRYVNRAI